MSTSLEHVCIFKGLHAGATRGGIGMRESAIEITRIDGGIPAALVPLRPSIDMCTSGRRFVQTCEHRLHEDRRGVSESLTLLSELPFQSLQRE